MRDARPQRQVSARVTDREAKAYRIVIFPDYIANNVFRSRTERSDRVFAVGKTADHQTGEPVEAAAPLKLAEHPVYIVEIFSYVFDK